MQNYDVFREMGNPLGVRTSYESVYAHGGANTPEHWPAQVGTGEFSTHDEVTFLGETHAIETFGAAVNAALKNNSISYRDLVEGYRAVLARIVESKMKNGDLVQSLDDVLPTSIPGDKLTYHVAIKLVLLDSESGKLRLGDIRRKLLEKWPGLLEKGGTSYNSMRNYLSRYMIFQKDWDDESYWRLDFAEDPVAIRYQKKTRTKTQTTKATKKTTRKREKKQRSPSHTSYYNAKSSDASTDVSKNTTLASGDAEGVWEGGAPRDNNPHPSPKDSPHLHQLLEFPPLYYGVDSTWAPLSEPLPEVSEPSRESDSDSSTRYCPLFDQPHQGGEREGTLGSATSQWFEGGLYTQQDGTNEDAGVSLSSALFPDLHYHPHQFF